MKNESRRHRERTLKVALSHVLYAHLRMPRTIEAFYKLVGVNSGLVILRNIYKQGMKADFIMNRNTNNIKKGRHFERN